MRCLDREEYYQDLRNYERKIEEDRLEHEQDLKNYQKALEEKQMELEQDRLEHEQKLAQTRKQYEAQIRQLRSENSASEKAMNTAGRSTPVRCIFQVSTPFPICSGTTLYQFFLYLPTLPVNMPNLFSPSPIIHAICRIVFSPC